MTDYQCVRASVLLIPQQQVCVASIFTPLDYVLYLKVLSLIILNIWYRLLYLLQELEQTLHRSILSALPLWAFC